MQTAQIVSWLRDKAARHGEHSYQRMLTVAADQLCMLQKRVDELETQASWPPGEQIFPDPGCHDEIDFDYRAED